MKILSKILLLLAFFGFISSTAYALQTKGVIIEYHLNSGIVGRDACIRMNPALPTSNWACIYNNNPLRSQLATLLREGYELKKTCAVAWNSVLPEGYANIVAASCY